MQNVDVPMISLEIKSLPVGSSLNVRIHHSGRPPCVVVAVSVIIDAILPTCEYSFRVPLDSDELIEVSGRNIRIEVPVVAFDAMLEVDFSLQTSSAGYSNGRLAMSSPACAVVGIDLAEPDHVPDFTPWNAIFCNCSVSVEAHSR